MSNVLLILSIVVLLCLFMFPFLAVYFYKRGLREKNMLPSVEDSIGYAEWDDEEGDGKKEKKREMGNPEYRY